MTATAATGRMPGDGWRTLARGLGQLLITAGVVILLFVVYELWATGLYTRAQQHDLSRELHEQWRGSFPDVSSLNVDKVPLGTGIAVLRIPRFGRGYHMVIVEGTATDDLKRGPGHYPGTALPGQVGNFAVAGHRTTYLAPFSRLDQIRRGDAIVLETKSRWFTYRVEDIPGTQIPYREIVSPTDVQVAYPVPDQPDPGKRPKLRLLTFTSCHPKYSAAQRIVVHGLLVESRPKSDGPPLALIGA